MSITVNQKTFTIETENSAYQMYVDRHGVLNHLWYGNLVNQDMSYLYDYPDIGFSGSIYEAGDDRTYSLDTRLQEYPVFGTGDYRQTAGKIRTANGGRSLDLRYENHEIVNGCLPLAGMPYVRPDANTETLKIVLSDEANGIKVELYYTVFETEDIVCRHAKFINESAQPVWLEEAASACLDFFNQPMDLIHFQGRHAMERGYERTRLGHGTFQIDSRRGTSSHQHNPGVILAEPRTDENQGNCYGALLMYSGSFQASIQKDPLDQVRLVMGINPALFEWKLEPGQCFETPQVLFSFSQQGFGQLSKNYHNLINRHVVPQRFQNKPRPILINNWEATYFDFDDAKILDIAEKASALGIEMIVLDDGWFGQRNNDSQGLGDWYVNESKLNGTLENLIGRIHEKGMRFGLWIEPEMVSEESSLYKEHPEWVLKVPGKNPVRSRYQLVLDLSNPAVVDYLFERFDKLLTDNRIEYIKWDMNRSITDFFATHLSADRQNEVPHRYVLGLYELTDRLVKAHPDVMFEGCSGGGGRFDAGILFYMPQIWTSDNTDAHDRCQIQYGTSFFYPVSTMASHVSAVPNHQTGRTTSLEARGVAAMHGSFGYELDLNLLTEAEQEEVKEQTKWYRRLQPLIYGGDYYRLTDPDENRSLWEFVSRDKKTALVQGLIYETNPNTLRQRVRLKGLDPAARYKCTATNFEEKPPGVFSGRALMEGGYLLPVTWGTDAPVTCMFRAVEGD